MRADAAQPAGSASPITSMAEWHKLQPSAGFGTVDCVPPNLLDGDDERIWLSVVAGPRNQLSRNGRCRVQTLRIGLFDSNHLQHLCQPALELAQQAVLGGALRHDGRPLTNTAQSLPRHSGCTR